MQNSPSRKRLASGDVRGSVGFCISHKGLLIRSSSKKAMFSSLK